MTVALAPPRVLVVEDEPNIRELVCLHLGHEGYACDGVGDGREALRRAQGERFDLYWNRIVVLMFDSCPSRFSINLCRSQSKSAICARLVQATVQAFSEGPAAG